MFEYSRQNEPKHEQTELRAKYAGKDDKRNPDHAFSTCMRLAERLLMSYDRERLKPLLEGRVHLWQRKDSILRE